MTHLYHVVALNEKAEADERVSQWELRDGLLKMFVWIQASAENRDILIYNTVSGGNFLPLLFARNNPEERGTLLKYLINPLSKKWNHFKIL